MKRILLITLLLPTLGFAAQQSSKPTIVHAAQSELESSLRHYETMTSEEERVTYLNEIFAKETADNRTDSELELLAQVLRGFYKVQRYQWLEKLQVSFEWRKCLVEHSPSLEEVFEVIDRAAAKKGTQVQAVTVAGETESKKVANVREPHPYEIVAKEMARFKELYPKGIQLDDHQDRPAIFAELQHYPRFTQLLIYTFLILDHAAHKQGQVDWGREEHFYRDFLESVWHELTPVERNRLRSIIKSHNKQVREFACKKATEAYYDQNLISIIENQTNVPKALAPLIAGYMGGDVYAWGVTIPQVLANRHMISSNIWRCPLSAAYRHVLPEDNPEFPMDKGRLDGIMLSSVAGADLISPENSKYLVLKDNMIEYLDFAHIPPNTRGIVLDRNPMVSIGADAGDIRHKLNSIELEHCCLSGLPEHLFRNAPNLRGLYLEKGSGLKLIPQHQALVNISRRRLGNHYPNVESRQWYVDYLAKKRAEKDKAAAL